MKFTVSIGIPAYNEEANIKQLLESLLAQKEDNFVLKEIIVVSDGSTDRTVEYARSFTDNRIKVIDDSVRKGTTPTQNEILEVAQGDILVMLDADVLPRDGTLVTQMVAPFYEKKNGKIGVVGGNPWPLPAKSLFEKIMNFGFFMRKGIYEKISNGDNIYLCHGRIRAFAKEFYKSFTWEKTASEDAYSYLLALKKGFIFEYAPQAKVWFKNPTKFLDHKRQSLRFLKGHERFKEYFGGDFVKQQYRIPFRIYAPDSFKSFLSNPFYFVSYVCIFLCVLLKSLFVKRVNPMWDFVSSTKHLGIVTGFSNNNGVSTVSVGIAAYNEAENILNLVNAILNQKVRSGKIIEILVLSDGSTDATDEIVRNIGDKRVRLIRHEQRKGLHEVQNSLLKEVTSQYFVSLDADIIPLDNELIEKLIAPFATNSSLGMTSAIPLPARPATFIEKVLARNHIFKTEIFKKINEGNNIYTCYGPARVLNRALYSKLHYPAGAPGDAFSYLFCLNEGLAFQCVLDAYVIFRCPSHLRDHVKQSSRFFAGKYSIIEIFGEQARKAYNIPKLLLAKFVIEEVIIHPISFLSYLAILLDVCLQKGKNVFSSQWDIATSSKTLRKLS